MKFTRDTDYIAQEVRKDLDKGNLPIWDNKDSYVFAGVDKDLIHDLKRWCAETRYADAAFWCTPKLTVPQVEFLRRLRLKLSKQRYRRPYDADLPIIADEELEEWGCTTETLGKSLRLVPDYENLCKEGKRRLPLGLHNQMQLFTNYPSIRRVGKSPQLVFDNENLCKEDRRRLPFTQINQMDLFTAFPAIRRHK